MKVSTWLICRLASLVPSACLKSMSSYFSASALAEELMAASQPWSACGPEKPMTTVSPAASLSLAGRWCRLLGELSAVGSGSLLVQPTSTAVVASSAPLAMRIRFSGVVGRTDM